jgi:hypothetical protein
MFKQKIRKIFNIIFGKIQKKKIKKNSESKLGLDGTVRL